MRHKERIVASSRDAVYLKLRAQGIKPIRVDEAPGVLNKVLGKGKRWVAIWFLSITIVLISIRFVVLQKNMTSLCEDRAQLYGDPVVIDAASVNGWFGTFGDVGDAWLARHAIPGRVCDCDRRKAQLANIAKSLKRSLLLDVEILDTDLQEVRKMKKMVNGMKRELRTYVEAGGTVEKYMYRVDIRQKAEAQILDTAKREVSRGEDQKKWQKRNSELRAMGLPMVVEDPEISPLCSE